MKIALGGDFGAEETGRQSDRKSYACATNTLLQSDRTGQTECRFVQAPGPTLQAGCCRQTVSRFVGPGANNAGRLLPSVQNWTIYRKDRSGAVTDRPGVELVFFFCAIRDRPVCTNTPCAGILAWPGVGVMLRCLRSNHFSTGSHNQKNTPKNRGECCPIFCFGLQNPTS